MAVNDNSQDNTQQQSGQQQRPSQGAAFANSRPAAPQEQRRDYTFRRLGDFARTALSRTPASEILTKLTKNAQDILDGRTDKSYEVSLMSIDYLQTSAMALSTLVVAVRDTLNKDLGVAYHVLILESSAEAPAPRYDMIAGQNVEILRTADAAWNNAMKEEVNKAIAQNFPNTKALLAGVEVVNRTFNIEDHQAVYNLISNASVACTQELALADPEFHDINLVEANAAKDTSLQVRYSFGNGQLSDVSGNPIRSEVQVEFLAAPQNQNQNSEERVSRLAIAAGFMDLVYSPAVPQNNQFAGAWQQQQQTNFQTYVMRFVITRLFSDQLVTPAAQLLSLVSALSLREQNAWIRAFATKAYAGDVDMHDIGAVGIEANLVRNPNGIGERIDTRSDSFREEQLVKLISTVVQPGLVVSMDIAHAGETTWYQDVFLYAANGNRHAQNVVVRAANELTNGNFSKYFPQDGQIADTEGNMIHLGHYTDRNGERRDLRDIDTLAVLNLVGEKDPAVARQWSDTYLQQERPLQLRLADRLRIMRGLFSDITVTGFATRVTFTQQFIDALMAAVADTQVAIRQVGNYADLATYQRATGNYLAGSVLAPVRSNVFNQGNVFGGQGNFYNFGQNVQSRW